MLFFLSYDSGTIILLIKVCSYLVPSVQPGCRPLHRPFSQAEQPGFGILPLASDVVCDAKSEYKEQNNITVHLNQQAPAKTLEDV